MFFSIHVCLNNDGRRYSRTPIEGGAGSRFTVTRGGKSVLYIRLSAHCWLLWYSRRPSGTLQITVFRTPQQWPIFVLRFYRNILYLSMACYTLRQNSAWITNKWYGRRRSVKTNVRILRLGVLSIKTYLEVWSGTLNLF